MTPQPAPAASGHLGPAGPDPDNSFGVALPETIRPLLEEGIAAGQFKDAADYLCFLVCMDGQRRLYPTFEEELVERLRSESRARVLGDDDVENIKREINTRRLEELRRELAAGFDPDEGEPLEFDATTKDQFLADLKARGRARL